MAKDNDFIEELYFTGTQSGPLVRFNNPRSDVIITWSNPPNDYTRHLKVHPPIIDWDEYDHLCYTLGKSIMDHFLGIK